MSMLPWTRQVVLGCLRKLPLALVMERKIRRRAVQVGGAGEYVGVFDLVVYAHMTGTVVKAWFGNELLDLLHLFAPVERALLSDDAPEVMLVATRIEDKETLPVDDVRRVNHWIAASRLDGIPVAIGEPVESIFPTRVYYRQRYSITYFPSLMRVSKLSQSSIEPGDAKCTEQLPRVIAQ